MATSPSITNYSILRATLAFTPEGGAQRDLGNAPECVFTPNVETLDHFSSRAGIRSKDRSVIVEKGGSLRIVMDELTAENFALAIAGTVTDQGGGVKDVSILSGDSTVGQIDITGTNTVGNKVSATFLNVSFSPSGDISFLSDEWGSVEITGEVLVDGNGDFGTITVTDQA